MMGNERLDKEDDTIKNNNSVPINIFLLEAGWGGERVEIDMRLV